MSKLKNKLESHIDKIMNNVIKEINVPLDDEKNKIINQLKKTLTVTYIKGFKLGLETNIKTLKNILNQL